MNNALPSAYALGYPMPPQRGWFGEIAGFLFRPCTRGDAAGFLFDPASDWACTRVSSSNRGTRLLSRQGSGAGLRLVKASKEVITTIVQRYVAALSEAM